ncbi:hypothetical protein [Pseudomonas abieticivorans]|uniref:hypothetical protein n=1 Tax=Pseudomonas abieticivorans TaxID=2931382 RepID=UPI0020C074E1|nr:hypothetical protein [Pseudomonas sp. PIA16]
MSTFTVYFCGTGSNRFDDQHHSYWNGELVSTLANNTLDKEFAHWIVLDGPGSGNLQSDELTIQTKDHPYAGVAFGTGWEENVNHAVNMIKGDVAWKRQKLTQENFDRLKEAGIPIHEVEEEGRFWWRTYDYGNRKVTQQDLQQGIIRMFRKDGILPTQVNLVGWSRGGISCHMLANAMLADPELKHIPVNIFAVDPVPGILNFQLEKVTLGNNVKEYVGLYARDERSKGFACVIPMTAANTKVSIYPMFGRHGTLVGNAAPDGNKGTKALAEPGEIVRHLAEVCLTRWDVSLDKMLMLDDRAIEQRQKAILAQESDYINMQKHSYTLITENEKGERAVSLGSKGMGFSEVNGPYLSPATGLSADLSMDRTLYKHIR